MKTNRGFLYLCLHPEPNHLSTCHLSHGLTCVFVGNKSVQCNQEPLLISEGGFKNDALKVETRRLSSTLPKDVHIKPVNMLPYVAQGLYWCD